MIITAWTHHDGGFGGISPAGELEVNRSLRVHGHVILTDSRHQRPVNHHVIGTGVGHDDAKFAECGDSHAAWLENGESFYGRWWEVDPDSHAALITRAYYDQDHPGFHAKTGH